MSGRHIAAKQAGAADRTAAGPIPATGECGPRRALEANTPYFARGASIGGVPSWNNVTNCERNSGEST